MWVEVDVVSVDRCKDPFEVGSHVSFDGRPVAVSGLTVCDMVEVRSNMT